MKASSPRASDEEEERERKKNKKSKRGGERARENQRKRNWCDRLAGLSLCPPMRFDAGRGNRSAAHTLATSSPAVDAKVLITRFLRIYTPLEETLLLLQPRIRERERERESRGYICALFAGHYVPSAKKREGRSFSLSRSRLSLRLFFCSLCASAAAAAQGCSERIVLFANGNEMSGALQPRAFDCRASARRDPRRAKFREYRRVDLLIGAAGVIFFFFSNRACIYRYW